MILDELKCLVSGIDSEQTTKQNSKRDSDTILVAAVYLKNIDSSATHSKVSTFSTHTKTRIISRRTRMHYQCFERFSWV